MEICVLSIGKPASEEIRKLISDYEKRISKYTKFISLIIPDLKNSKSLAINQIKEEEGKLILNELNPSDLVIVLDEKGKEFKSRNFAEWIEKLTFTGKKRMVFVIGGPYGFSDSVYARQDHKISLSQMTFTHEMAKLFLTEQIYRAFTILRNEPYHHD